MKQSHIYRKYMVFRYLCVSFVVVFGVISIIGSGGGIGRGGYDIPDLIHEDNLYTSISIADLNGDDAQDIAVTYIVIDNSPPHPSNIAVMLQDPLEPGSFYAPDYYAVGNDAWSIAIGDLNDDDLPDLVTANTESDNISLLFQDTIQPGKFLSAINLSTGTYPNHVAIGDINGDGLNDLTVADKNTSILIQNPSMPGAFLPLTDLDLRSYCVAIGDLNDDNIIDLATTRAVDGAVAITLQDPSDLGQFLPTTYFDTGSQPIFVAIGLIDGDSLPDLAVVNYGPPDGSIDASVSVLFQDPNASGNFIYSNDYITGRRSDEVAIEDLNGDDLFDLAIVNSRPRDPEKTDGRGTISVLLQNPQDVGYFFNPDEYRIIFQPLSIAIGDLDGDTLPDIAVADDGARILFQNPDSRGKFFSPVHVGG
jgi:hypothetical protein